MLSFMSDHEGQQQLWVERAWTRRQAACAAEDGEGEVVQYRSPEWTVLNEAQTWNSELVTLLEFSLARFDCDYAPVSPS